MQKHGLTITGEQRARELRRFTRFRTDYVIPPGCERGRKNR